MSNEHKDEPVLFNNIISYYPESYAIEDGVLVHPYPERWKNVLVTNSIHQDCAREDVKDGRSYDQRLTPLITDCLITVDKATKEKKGEPEFPIVLENTISDTVWVMPNDIGGYTIMKPEDY